jgi:predicted nucleic acid-binding protein
MSDAYVDADVIVRLLTGDDAGKQRRAARLFERVERGEIRLRTPVTTIADVIYVLTSPRLYAVPRGDAAEMVKVLVRLPGFDVGRRESVLGALDLFAASRLDFGDALIAAEMAWDGTLALYSFDRDFDRLTGLRRREP